MPAEIANQLLYYSKKLAISFGILIALVQRAYSQHSVPPERPNLPIPLEFMAGNHEFTFQTQINKYFTSHSNFNFLSITSATSPYKNDVKEFDFINTSQISYSLHNGIGVSAGVNMNAKTGFSPTAGLQYVLATKSILFVLAPGVLLTNDHNLQVVSVWEYKPLLHGDWRLYSKLQGFYNYNTSKKFQQRSYFYARAGISYNLVTTGFGSDLDWYGGPSTTRKDNYGIFILYSFL